MSQERLSEKALEFKKLYELSFMFSEGSINTQKIIFQWLVVKGHMVKDDYEEARYSLWSVAPPPSPYHIKRNALQIYWANFGAMNTLDLIFSESDKSVQDGKSIANELTLSLLSLERRRVKEGRSEKNLLRDQKGSLLREFVIIKRNINNQPFKELLEDIGICLRRQRKEHSNVLNGLVAHWELNHPGEKFFPD